MWRGSTVEQSSWTVQSNPRNCALHRQVLRFGVVPKFSNQDMECVLYRMNSAMQVGTIREVLSFLFNKSLSSDWSHPQPHQVSKVSFQGELPLVHNIFQVRNVGKIDPQCRGKIASEDCVLEYFSSDLLAAANIHGVGRPAEDDEVCAKWIAESELANQPRTVVSSLIKFDDASRRSSDLDANA